MNTIKIRKIRKTISNFYGWLSFLSFTYLISSIIYFVFIVLPGKEVSPETPISINYWLLQPILWGTLPLCIYTISFFSSPKSKSFVIIEKESKFYKNHKIGILIMLILTTLNELPIYLKTSLIDHYINFPEPRWEYNFGCFISSVILFFLSIYVRNYRDRLLSDYEEQS
jgi:hypothetical protein